MKLRLTRWILVFVFILPMIGLSHVPRARAQDGNGLDDLDKYFEDYFEEETPPQNNQTSLDEEPASSQRNLSSTQDALPKSSLPDQAQAQTPPSVAPAFSQSDKQISQSISSKLASADSEMVPQQTESASDTGKPSETKESYEFSMARHEQSGDFEMVSLAKNRMIPGTDGLELGGSYLDAAEQDDEFNRMLAQKRQFSRFAMMDQIADFLIGEEVEKPALQIQGSLVQGPTAAPAFKTLQDAISEATEKHLPIEIAKEKVLLYRRHINKAMRDLFPSAVVSYSDTRQTLGNGPDTTTLEKDYKVSVRQPIYQGGSLWNKVREEKSNLKSAMAEYKKIFADLALEVATAYFNLAKTKTMLTFREQLLAKANQALDLSEEKFKANLISEIEHLNVQSQQSQINSSLQQAREEVELAMLEVQKSMNLDIDEPIDVYNLEEYFDLMGGAQAFEDEKDKTGNGILKQEDQAKDSKAEETKINELIRMAYENRPEFVIGEYKVRARRYAEKGQKGAWLPQLSVFAELGQNKNILAFNGEPGNKYEDEFRAGVEASWNIFGNTVRYLHEQDDRPPTRSGFSAGGKGDFRQSHTLAVGILDNLEQYSKAQEAEVATKEAILEFELSEKDMISEVKESYYNFNRAKIQMKSVLKKIKYREKLVELASHRSEINEIQLSEYLQAEIDLVEERNTFYQAMVDFFVARASLNKAIGISNFLNVEKLPLDLLR